jgi:arylsulfatase A-like enzyme
MKQGRQLVITKINPQSGLFVYLLMFTALFSLLEISFFIQGSGLYLVDFKYISAHLSIPFAIVPGVVFYFCAQISLHVLFTVLVWVVARLIGILLGCSWKHTQTIGFYLWGIAFISILLLNQYFFPNSKYADLMGLFNLHVTHFLFNFFAFLSIISLSLALLGGMVLMLRIVQARALIAITLLLILTGINFSHYPRLTQSVEDVATTAKPNIIIIGIDSLRPDYVGYFGSPLATPHIDEFFNHSAVFAEAITPIARTFPAWVSLLTGQYPKKNGARFDLMDQTSLDLSETLPAILREQGYQTVFAMDETRFSNIDKNFGFDEIVTPPAGLNDFLLGTFNDFPLSNLLVNTRLGQWLFPYSYANRPAFITYQPSSFQALLQQTLVKDRTKPLFLAVHFCLPHYPYYWADYLSQHATNGVEHYHASIERIDRQLNDFLILLKQDHLLDHSIVVLMSDHGEALELQGDRVTASDSFIPGADNKKSRIPHFYPPSLDDEAVNESVGHGTDVLSMSQYHSVLAFRFYGVEKPAQLVPGIVTLLDIKPTLLNYLNIATHSQGGISLSDYIDGKKSTVLSTQDIFLESDFSPAAIHTAHPETRQLVFEGVDFFEINPVTTRLTVKKTMGQLIISSKQYADIYGSWILALYPQSMGGMMPILVNLNTGQWTNDLRTPFALKSPANHMLQALKTFYGHQEITLVQNS